jgi:hypothetical protein
MTITLENNSDVIVYALEKIISFARENQYLFMANCAWWIAGIIGFDSGLIAHINNLVFRQNNHCQQVSPTHCDIARSVSASTDQVNFEEEIIATRNKVKPVPLRTIKSTRSNPGKMEQKLSKNPRRKLAKANRVQGNKTR